METIGDQGVSYAKEKPLLATWSDTTIETRQDGTRVSNLSLVVTVARNSSGKVYTEYWWPNRIPKRGFSLDDPLTGTVYFWSEQIKDVTVLHYHGINSREEQASLQKWPWLKHLWSVPVCATYGLDSGDDSEEVSIQNIGTSQILGLDAEGILATRYSDSLTEERWFSSNLQIPLITRVGDSTGDTSLREIKSLRQGEPDPKLFRIPEGYAIKEKIVSTDRNR